MNEIVTNSTAPVESTQPAQPVRPAEPAQPVRQAESASPAKPAEPSAMPGLMRTSKKTWFITASYTISGAIFAWSIALSMSSTAETAVPASPVSERGKLSAVTTPPTEKMAENRSAADSGGEPAGGDSYRAEAIALDQEFLRRHKLRRQQRHRLPSHEDATQHWRAQVDKLRRQLRHNPNPPKHSIMWGQKKKLEALLSDPPQSQD